MHITSILAIAAALFIGSAARAQTDQSLQALTSTEVAALPSAGGRIGVAMRPGRAFPRLEAFSAEIIDIKEQSAFLGRLKPGEHIVAVQSYSFRNVADMIRYIDSLPPKSPVRLLVADEKNGNLRVVKGQLITANQLVATTQPSKSTQAPQPPSTSVAAAVKPAESSQKEEASCIKEGAKGALVAVVGAAILVGLDCIFTACTFTATALASTAAATATGAVIAKGAVIAATGAAAGCAKGLIG